MHRTPLQQKEHERRQALAALDIAAMRAWAERYAVGLLGDDRTVLISMHEARVLDRRIPTALAKASFAWLQAEHPESSVLGQARQYGGEFRGPRYSKVRG
jgi:hypothetical protein